MHKRAIAAAAVIMAAALGAGAGSASAIPDTRLPDFTLYCGSTTVLPSQSVVIPFTGGLWITEGDLAGHYVVISEAHYLYPGELSGPLEGYAGLPEAAKPVFFGKKSGLAGKALSCDFVSWWSNSGTSIVGPVTLAEVPR